MSLCDDLDAGQEKTGCDGRPRLRSYSADPLLLRRPLVIGWGLVRIGGPVLLLGLFFRGLGQVFLGLNQPLLPLGVLALLLTESAEMEGSRKPVLRGLMRSSLA